MRKRLLRDTERRRGREIERDLLQKGVVECQKPIYVYLLKLSIIVADAEMKSGCCKTLPNPETWAEAMSFD